MGEGIEEEGEEKGEEEGTLKGWRGRPEAAVSMAVVN